MIEENERAAKFIKAIQRDGEQRRAAIMKTIDETAAAEIAQIKATVETKTREIEEYERVRLQENTNRRLSNSVLRTGAELAKKRSEITHEVFESCKQKILAFTEEPAYSDYLAASAEALLNILHSETAVFYASAKDIDLVKTKVPASCRVEIDPEIYLGGLRAKVGTMEADDTLDVKLETQKEWFLQNSGMSIAL